MANYPHPTKGSRYGKKGEGRVNVGNKPRINHNAGVRIALAEDRKVQAEIRAESRSKRSAQEQLNLLDQRLGKGIGAAKERKRLNAFITGGKMVEAQHRDTKVRPSQKKAKAAQATA
jgi:hypothetical protein